MSRAGKTGRVQLSRRHFGTLVLGGSAYWFANGALAKVTSSSALPQGVAPVLTDGTYRDGLARSTPEEEKSTLLDQFISMRLAADAAEKDGVAKEAKVQDQLALARLNVLVDSGLQQWLEKHPVTDEELRPEYDAQVAQMPKEYHARHILVDDQAKADAITKELKAGGDFAKAAEKNSKDPSGKSGGDLGWFTLETMVKPFSDAVAALEPGKMTDKPVQSQFGWHIIKLEESRVTAPPAFEEVKDRVKMIVQRKKLQNYLDELRKGAKIEKKI